LADCTVGYTGGAQEPALHRTGREINGATLRRGLHDWIAHKQLFFGQTGDKRFGIMYRGQVTVLEKLPGLIEQ
jgi:hypothetical protein